MKPYIVKGDLTKLHVRKQGQICNCNPRCKEFLLIQTKLDEFMLCKMDGEEFAFELLEQLGLVTKKQAFPKSNYGWTTEQERFVIKYLKEKNRFDENGKVKFGTYTLIGEMLGKSRSAVKDKVNHLRKAGRI